jgi:hypothetical protein
MNFQFKTPADFICLAFFFGAMGCTTPSAVEWMTEDNLALGQLTTSGKPALSAAEITDRAQANGKLKETSSNLPVFSFKRKVIINRPTDKNATGNPQTKTYQAYSNNRDQTLIKVNGRQPTLKEIEEDREKNRKRQRRFLERNGKKGSDKMMSHNMDLYKEKFIPRLISTETVNGRPAYLIQLMPDTNHKIKNGTVDRIMNQMLTKLWVDQEDFQVSRLEAELVKPIGIVVGLIGSIKTIRIRLEQQRLTPQVWTDLKIDADFDIRILTANYTFSMKSQSSGFKPVKAGKLSEE